MPRQRALRATSAHRPPGERALAWMYTGPPGHLWSTVADIALMWLRWAALRLRERVHG